MVYEIKCHNCGDLIDWGGERPEETLDPSDDYPDDVMKFDGKWYCKDCVEKFVIFGIGEMGESIDWLQDRMMEVLDTLGIDYVGGPPKRMSNENK